jgi:hypothetical protein
MAELPPAYSEFEDVTNGRSGTEAQAKLVRDGLVYQQMLPLVVASHSTSGNYVLSADHLREVNSVYPDEARMVNVKLVVKNTGSVPTMLSKVMYGDVNIMPTGPVTHLYVDGKRVMGTHCLTVGDTIELDMPIKWSKEELNQLTRRAKDPYAQVCTHMPVARVDSAVPPVVYLPVVKLCNGEPHVVRLAYQAFKAGIKPKRDKMGGPFLYPIETKSWEQCIEDIRMQMDIESRGLVLVFTGEPATVMITMTVGYNTGSPEWRKPSVEGGKTVMEPVLALGSKNSIFIPSATVNDDSVDYLSSSDLWTKKKMYKRFMRKTAAMHWLTNLSNNPDEDIYTALCQKTGESARHDAMTAFMANAIRFYTRQADLFEPATNDLHLSLRNIDESSYSKILRSDRDGDTTIAKCMALMEAMLSVAINSKKDDFGPLSKYDGEENPMQYISHWIDGCPILHDAVLGQYVKVKV